MTVKFKSKSYASSDLQAFYTDADDIRVLMQELLGEVEGKTVLEPCAGQGAFLDGLIGSPKNIHAVDIDPLHIDHLKARFNEDVDVFELDFIQHSLSSRALRAEPLNFEYDAIICNPPYGLKFTVEYRKVIKKAFPDLYARESYGLFVYFGIELLKRGGRFVYIVPDTFFTSRNHTPLRRYFSQNTTLTEIIQFRSKRFETVNFGYGSLCIIAGNKGRGEALKNIKWSDARKTNEPLRTTLFDNFEEVPQSLLSRDTEAGWIHPATRRAVKFPKTPILLGEIAECRTGIYTGDNKRFCAYNSNSPPSRANGHSIEWQSKVEENPISQKERIKGIIGTKCYVPFVRGGHRRPFEETGHAIDWSESAVVFYGSDQKARLQNHRYYFRSGLAVPMVTSGRLSASLMSNSIFDQGVVGIFPQDENLLSFLLIYLNSKYATDQKQLINPSANNSANYLKRLPIPVATKATQYRANSLVTAAKENGWESIQQDAKRLIEELLE